MKDIKILFEDADILAVLKPAGISVHKDGKREDEYTIADWFLEKYPKSKNVGEAMELPNGEKVERPGIVHRLDKETSGVLLLAKSKEGYADLKRQFKDRKIKKTYHAFVYGKLRDERGIIEKPIGRATGSVRKWSTPPKTRGELREATTRFKVLKEKREGSLLELWPLTGRTHQIRVHMLSVGHPVVADSLYATARPKLFGFSRLALHASRITFHDLSQKTIELEAPFPPDFEEAIKEIEAK